MAIHCRQICLVAEHLAPAINRLSSVFSLPNCYVDPAVGKFGLENTLLLVGSQFIEVVAPLKNHSDPSSTAAGRFLKRRGGDGGYMVICQVSTREQQDQVRQRAAELDIRVAFESDRGTWNIMQLHPADMGAAFFEVDWDHESDMQGNWHPAGGKQWMGLQSEGKSSTEVISAITAVELQSDDPMALAQRWAQVAGVSVEHAGSHPIVPLENIDIRFVQATDGRGPGLSGLDVKVRDYERLLDQAKKQNINLINNCLTLCGTRFYLT